jgi:predicted DNA-binding antitoxin AbrB/MazE fold protein
MRRKVPETAKTRQNNLLKLKEENIKGDREMPIAAVYRKGVIKPLEKLDLKENEEIEIEIKRKAGFEKFHGRLEVDEKTADEIIEMEIWG